MANFLDGTGSGYYYLNGNSPEVFSRGGGKSLGYSDGSGSGNGGTHYFESSIRGYGDGANIGSGNGSGIIQSWYPYELIIY